MIKCKMCHKETKNKVYCSIECQYKGYRTKKLKKCEVCDELHSNARFCSATCYSKTNSELRKQKISKDGHWTLGRKQSIKERQLRSISGIIAWSNDISRERRLVILENVRQKYFEEHGAHLGWTEASKQKRIQTNFNLFGIEHNWNGNYGERKCDKTFEIQYGMTSAEYRQLKLFEKAGQITRIERIVETYLIKYNITYIYQFKFKNRFFDFYLPEYNILIECDGDYHHGFGVKNEDLDQIQFHTRLNDIYKNLLVETDDSIKLVRFWGSQIEDTNFEHILQQIWQK